MVAHLVVKVGAGDDGDAWIVVVVVGLVDVGLWLRLAAVRGRRFQGRDHHECVSCLICVLDHLICSEDIDVTELLMSLKFPSYMGGSGGLSLSALRIPNPCSAALPPTKQASNKKKGLKSNINNGYRESITALELQYSYSSP